MKIYGVKTEVMDGIICETPDGAPLGARVRRVPEGFAALEEGEEWADDTSTRTHCASDLADSPAEEP